MKRSDIKEGEQHVDDTLSKKKILKQSSDPSDGGIIPENGSQNEDEEKNSQQNKFHHQDTYETKEHPQKKKCMNHSTKHSSLRIVDEIRKRISPVKRTTPLYPFERRRSIQENEQHNGFPKIHTLEKNEKKKKKKKKNITRNISPIQIPTHRNISTFVKRNNDAILKSSINTKNNEEKNSNIIYGKGNKKGNNKHSLRLLKEGLLNINKRPRDFILKFPSEHKSNNRLENNKKKVKVDTSGESDDVIFLHENKNLPCRSEESAYKCRNTKNNNLKNCTDGMNANGINTFSFVKIPFSVKRKNNKVNAKMNNIVIASAQKKSKNSSVNLANGEKKDILKNVSFKKVFSAEEAYQVDLNYDNTFNCIQEREEEKVKKFYNKFYKCAQASKGKCAHGKHSEGVTDGAGAENGTHEVSAENIHTTCLQMLDTPSDYCKACKKFLKLLIAHGTKYKGILVSINFIHARIQNILYTYRCAKQHNFNLSLFHIMYNLWCPHDYCLFECKSKHTKSYATEFFRLKELDTMEKQKDLFLQAKMCSLINAETALIDNSENVDSKTINDVERIIKNANNPWEVLQIQKFSRMELHDKKELKRIARKNYHTLALKVHPDKNKSKNASLAMNILTNSIKAITSVW
ncbi:DnaJ domain containing protein [Plasmodium gonderi]|uniref:DnaJ domain containing protein n=1 Tax=Plasmodium gonderi TaxID=77519 RepID=A0A1Y1JJP8_PLAGO|nr:DnaJ domain containing protein [Plasmodium gonderi]GAW81032.1 DnaJ domain containing protein [Plasmodium gonderi]